MTSRYVTMSHFCMIYAYIYSRSEANYKLKPERRHRDMVNGTGTGAGSGMCELTNQSRAGIQDGGGGNLKDTLNALNSMRTTMHF